MFMLLFEWEHLTVIYHPLKVGYHRHCGGEDKMDLVCHVMPQDHVTEGLFDFMSGSCVSS